MKLYHCPDTRSFRPLWLLEEIRLPYEIELVEIFKGQGGSADYRRINPLGKVPTLQDNGAIIFEAGAICTYLTEKYAPHLAPAMDSPQRALYYQWLFFVPATMEPPLMNIFLHTKLLPEQQRLPLLVEQGKKLFDRISGLLNQEMQDKKFILGNDFSTADIMLVSTLLWFPELIGQYPKLLAYTDRATQRPAYQSAKAKQ